VLCCGIRAKYFYPQFDFYQTTCEARMLGIHLRHYKTSHTG